MQKKHGSLVDRAKSFPTGISMLITNLFTLQLFWRQYSRARAFSKYAEISNQPTTPPSTRPLGHAVPLSALRLPLEVDAALQVDILRPPKEVEEPGWNLLRPDDPQQVSGSVRKFGAGV